MTHGLSLAHHLPITFFIALKLLHVRKNTESTSNIADVTTHVLCSLMSGGQILAAFAGYCNVCTACNTINLSLLMHLCTSVSGQRTVHRLYFLSFACTSTCEPAGNIPKTSLLPGATQRDVRCAIWATNQWHSSIVKVFSKHTVDALGLCKTNWLHDSLAFPLYCSLISLPLKTWLGINNRTHSICLSLETCQIALK